MFFCCCMHVHCLCYCTAQGESQAAHDILLTTKTIAYRSLAPVPLWKVLPDRPFEAATKRFDALITGLIAQEKARLAAAGVASTTTASSSGTDEVTDTSSVKGSCLLTQLVQYGIAAESATADATFTADKDNKHIESTRYALTSNEVRPELHYHSCYSTDTLGGGLAWLLYELGVHQDVQQKLRDEITAVMKGDLYKADSCSYSYNMGRKAYDINCSVRCCSVERNVVVCAHEISAVSALLLHMHARYHCCDRASKCRQRHHLGSGELNL
eukprot:17897-Heterococcus_DN1.PRE.2